MTQTRLNRLIQFMSGANVDALVLNPGPTLLYLTGLNFHLMERPTTLIIKPPHQIALVVPELEIPKVSSSKIPVETYSFGDNPSEWSEVFQKAVDGLSLDGLQIAVEPIRLRYLELTYLQKAAPKSLFVSGQAIFDSLRMQKDAEEISTMRQAAKIAQDALTATLPQVKVGVTERELAAELSINLLRAGSDSELPFQPIVATGPNSANPHAVPTDRKVEAGDLVLFDWGAAYHGYFSDITRTYAVAQITPEMVEIYRLVEKANAAGRERGKPGLRAGEIDHSARSVIQHGGYGSYFTHRTGHGLGMEAHEGPYMYAENDLLLEPGMVYTVEPGIYLSGKGGVRIEDDVVITDDGCESLTDYSRELTIL